MNTHETYVSLEVAKLLKEAGFDWECKKIHFKTGYKGNDDVWELEDNYKNTKRVLELDYCLLAPTLDVAQRWLREVKHIDVIANRNSSPLAHLQFLYNPEYDFDIIDNDGKLVTYYPMGETFDTYEEALEAGIKKCLEIILEKGK